MDAVRGSLRDAFDLTYSANTRWTPEEAADWKARLPWTMGCNFTPSYAVNPIETWDASLFDRTLIESELALAADIGMNTARVYLHNLAWEADPAGFLDRVDALVGIAWSKGIRTMPVMFDSCWHPEPVLGPQPRPVPGVHNSGWVQCPGMSTLMDAARHAALRDYVRAVTGRFADDPRILAWDVWNEPDNGLEVSACDPVVLEAKATLVQPLLRKAFGWIRGMRPIQPLTSGIWLGDWSSDDLMTPLQRDQIGLSDIVTFHNYEPGPDFVRRIGWLRRFGRPLICTEFMARPVGSTFQAILPLARAHDVGAVCWGLVAGRTQTQFSWSSWKERDPVDAQWFHEVFRSDGTPYDPAETEFMRSMTGLAA